jgi:hypothetical protein
MWLLQLLWSMTPAGVKPASAAPLHLGSTPRSTVRGMRVSCSAERRRHVTIGFDSRQSLFTVYFTSPTSPVSLSHVIRRDPHPQNGLAATATAG